MPRGSGYFCALSHCFSLYVSVHMGSERFRLLFLPLLILTSHSPV